MLNGRQSRFVTSHCCNTFCIMIYIALLLMIESYMARYLCRFGFMILNVNNKISNGRRQLITVVSHSCGHQTYG